MSEPLLQLRLTYAGALAGRADLQERGKPLPELSLAEIAAACDHFPNAFFDALADKPQTVAHVILLLSQSGREPDHRLRNIGAQVAIALLAYLSVLVQHDVDQLVERGRKMDALEDRLSHREVLGADAELACELGMGRSLHS